MPSYKPSLTIMPKIFLNFDTPMVGKTKRRFAHPTRLIVVTRNENDFIAIGVMLLNPFQKPGSLG